LWSWLQFIDEPLGYFTVLRTNVAQVLSPNTISVLGVFIALLSARYIGEHHRINICSAVSLLSSIAR
jgi:hypothetical protein